MEKKYRVQSLFSDHSKIKLQTNKNKWKKKEVWVLKNWCFWTVVLEKTLESTLDCKIKPVHPKRNQSWILIGRTNAEAEAPILWSTDKKSWCWERLKAVQEGHLQVNGHEFEQAPGDGEGQGSLACWNPWGSRVSMTEQLSNTPLWRLALSGWYATFGGSGRK